MRRTVRVLLRTLLALLLIAAAFAAFWFGLVPQRYSPLAPISLAEPPSWFVDFRLAALRRDPTLCRSVLAAPHIAATPIHDNAIRNGCGWVNAVRVGTVGGAQLGAAQLTCEAAAALALSASVPAAAQDLVDRVIGRPVTAMTFEIEGRAVASADLASLVPIKVGDPLRLEALRDGESHLINAGRYDSVQIAFTENPAGIDLIVRLTPRHPIDQLQFKGDTGLTAGELERLTVAARLAAGAGLEVHAGHGLTFDTVAGVARLPEVVELNIGHFLVGEAIFGGLPSAVKRMRALMEEARNGVAPVRERVRPA